MDYRSALYESGNYRLAKSFEKYKISDKHWRCKTEEQKEK